MNDFHLMNLANDINAARRAEADRYRLVRSGHAEGASTRPAPRSRRAAGPRVSLGTLLHRVALF